jgi:hypothetical protein
VLQTYPEPGAVVSAETLWRLAVAWYGDRLQRAWEPHDAGAAQEILESVGLCGDFWKLRV